MTRLELEERVSATRVTAATSATATATARTIRRCRISIATDGRRSSETAYPDPSAASRPALALRAVKLGAGGGGEVIESVMDDTTARRIVTQAGWTITSAEDLADLGLPQLAGACLFIRAANT